MRHFALLSAVLAFALAKSVFAQDARTVPSAPQFRLPESGAAATGTHRDSDVAFVLVWLRQVAPECPVEAAPEIAGSFLNELARSHPEAADRIGQRDFPSHDYESLLLQTAAAGLKGAKFAAPREALALRRARVVLAHAGGTQPTAGKFLARLQEESAFNHRRLLEGKMDDEELMRLAKSGRADPSSRSVSVGSAKPQELTASEIVSEFSRHNQAGAALTRLHGYLLEARVRPAGGTEQTLLVGKLRPDRFRLLVSQGGESQIVLGYDGTQYWRQAAGKPAEVIPGEAAVQLRSMGDFIDPLFEPEGTSFERLADMTLNGRACYRLAVTHSGERYVVALDRENFHLLERENRDGVRTRYSDFREFAGITLAHREESRGADGRTAVLEIVRLVANPGLVDAYFSPPAPGELDFFIMDRLLAAGPGAMDLKTNRTP